MNDDDSQQAWWDSDLQKERADEEVFWRWMETQQDDGYYHDWMILNHWSEDNADDL